MEMLELIIYYELYSSSCLKPLYVYELENLVWTFSLFYFSIRSWFMFMCPQWNCPGRSYQSVAALYLLSLKKAWSTWLNRLVHWFVFPCRQPLIKCNGSSNQLDRCKNCADYHNFFVARGFLILVFFCNKCFV